MRSSARWVVVAALLMLLVAGVVWSRLAPGATPAGQPPLVTLDAATLQALRADFNREPSHARVIVLLSPT